MFTQLKESGRPRGSERRDIVLVQSEADCANACRELNQLPAVSIDVVEEDCVAILVFSDTLAFRFDVTKMGRKEIRLSGLKEFLESAKTEKVVFEGRASYVANVLYDRFRVRFWKGRVVDVQECESFTRDVCESDGDRPSSVEKCKIGGQKRKYSLCDAPLTSCC